MVDIPGAIGRRLESWLDPTFDSRQRTAELRQRTAEELRQSRDSAESYLRTYRELLEASPGLAEQINATDLRRRQGEQPLQFADRADQTRNAVTVLDAATGSKAALQDNLADNQLRAQGGTVRQLVGDYHGQDQAMARIFVGDGNLTDKLIGASAQQNNLTAALIREQLAASRPSGIQKFTQALAPVLAVASLFA